jgi:fructoselysine 6-kinase
MSKKVVAVGDNCVDIYYTLNQFYPTGNAVDFAINLSQLGCEIALVSIKGNDIFGKSIENVLNKSGIDLSHFHKEISNQLWRR